MSACSRFQNLGLVVTGRRSDATTPLSTRYASCPPASSSFQVDFDVCDRQNATKLQTGSLKVNSRLSSRTVYQVLAYICRQDFRPLNLIELL